MELSNDSFLALLEECISKRDGNSAKKFMTFSTEHTVFYTLRVGALRAIRYTHRAQRVLYSSGGRALRDKV